MAPERRCRWPRPPAGGPKRLGAEGNVKIASPLVGLVLIRPAPPLPSPPMNSLPPLRWPIALDGVVVEGRVGECGGVTRDFELKGAVSAEGLNKKSGNAAEPRERCDLAPALGIGGGGMLCCDDCGRLFRAFQLSRVGEASADRAGKTKSGFGSNSMLCPISGAPRRWYSGDIAAVGWPKDGVVW